MSHEIKRESGGKNESGWIQAQCSCGWQGKPHYAHNDYQHSNYKEEVQQHMRSMVATLKHSTMS